MSLGDLSEEEVEGIRSGSISDPSIAQVTALANVFGVQPSYLCGLEQEAATHRRGGIEILRDETVRTIAHKSLHLPPRDRQMILNIIWQFEDMKETDEGNDAMPMAPG